MTFNAISLLKSDAAEKACEYLTSVLGTNPLLLTELDLSGKKPGDSRVKQFCALLEDSHCRLKTLKLNNSSITEGGCADLTSALRSNPSHLIELNLSGNKLGDSGVKHISALLQNPHCKLQKLLLNNSSITAEGCAALTSALRSNPSHLIELHLSGNKLGDSGVKHISDLLENPNNKLEKLELLTRHRNPYGKNAGKNAGDSRAISSKTVGPLVGGKQAAGIQTDTGCTNPWGVFSDVEFGSPGTGMTRAWDAPPGTGMTTTWDAPPGTGMTTTWDAVWVSWHRHD
ncbi:ribonuclease inhibitor-like [Clupea harengus]|uniref:Ribonuclease inhibitor-like n=1 Tax=Clupea harengus TaxID=7950 RepID=A0A8M1K4J1_CLUHA|nr:ribonuclease inhibitor-like [Clupea harengus]